MSAQVKRAIYHDRLLFYSVLVTALRIRSKISASGADPRATVGLEISMEGPAASHLRKSGSQMCVIMYSRFDLGSTMTKARHVCQAVVRPALSCEVAIWHKPTVGANNLKGFYPVMLGIRLPYLRLS
jgi:hypothetical protein